METRKCRKCGRELPLTEEYFYRRSKSFRRECKDCTKKYEKELRSFKNRKIESKKLFDLVDPKTWESVETITNQELLDRLGVKFLGKKTMVDGLMITER